LKRYAVRAGALAFVVAITLLGSPTNSAHVDDQPTIMKDTVQVTAFTVNEYKKNYDFWSWLPMTKFRVNGPIPSGGQLYVEFTLPNWSMGKLRLQN
jgi:hypothetical protein